MRNRLEGNQQHAAQHQRGAESNVARDTPQRYVSLIRTD